jgi:Cu+-exporting ATPase
MGSSFYIGAYKSLSHLSANMDVLIILGTTAAWGYGIAMIIIGYPEEEKMDLDMYRMAV